MLHSRHGRTRSTQVSQTGSISPSLSRNSQAIAIPQAVTITEWSRTSSYVVSHLLSSLQQIFNRADQFNGSTNNSHGLLLSSDSAYIFPYAATPSTPPILTFPLPQGESKLLGALIPGPSNEPGLLIVMPTTGNIGFWPALHSALASTSGIESQLSLSSGEYVTHLCNAGAAGSVISTSSGRMLHISLRDATGKPVVTVSTMSLGGGWLNAIRNATTRRDIVSINAGAAQSRDERQVHAISRKGQLTIWEVARAGNHRSLLDVDLSILLVEEDVREVLDVVAYPIEANSVLILARSKDTTKLLGIQFDSQAQPSFSHRFTLPALEEPKIFLPNPGHVAFVQAEQSIFIISIQEKHVETIKLHKDILVAAAGTEDQFKKKQNPALILLTREAGVLRLELLDRTSKREDSIRSRLEQAVFFGYLEGNPLSFSPSPRHADIAARAISKEILIGQSRFLSAPVQLGEALHERVVALENLTHYIIDNIEQETKQALREDIERMIAGEALWHSVDARVEGNTIIRKILPGPSHREDQIRGFFSHGLKDVANIITATHKLSIESAAILDSGPLGAIVSECNEIVLAILLSAIKYRDGHSEYGSDGEKWTSSAEIRRSLVVQVDIVQRLTAGLVEDENSDLRDQLVGLVSVACRVFEDHLSYVDDAKERTKYLKHRPQWLQSLVKCNRTDRALEIGEKYGDYKSLIEICHEQGQNANDEDIVNSVIRRLEWYLHTFGYDFASELWTYYIKERQFWNLLHEFPNYRNLLTQFFSDGRYPNISWMNDVILEDFAKAGQTLLSVKEQHAEKRKVQLSIAKLALMADGGNPPESLELQLAISSVMCQLTQEVQQLTIDAIDDDAAVDLACSELIPEKLDTNYAALLRSHIIALLQSQSIAIGAAIDYLTIRNEPNFAYALQLLSNSKDLPDAVYNLLYRQIWRRCLLVDDWARINATTDLSDASIAAVTSGTQLFSTISSTGLSPPPVSELIYLDNGARPYDCSETEMKVISSTSKRESDKLQELKSDDIERWMKSITASAMSK